MNTEVAEIEVSYSHKIESANRVKISCSEDAFNMCKSFWKYPMDYRECAYAIYMDKANSVLGYFLVSVGGISGTVIDVRLVIETALKVHASSIILAHNHPSGNNRPSEADLSITGKMKDACAVLDILLLDHLIVYSGGYTSLADVVILLSETVIPA